MVYFIWGTSVLFGNRLVTRGEVISFSVVQCSHGADFKKTNKANEAGGVFWNHEYLNTRKQGQ